MSEDVVNLILKETVRYAGQKGRSLQLKIGEIYCVVAILFLSGYVSIPRRRMFWEDRDDVRNTLVVNSMRRKKFEDIFVNLHFADNDNLQKDDKFAKIRPLLEALNEKFITFAPIEKSISVDESMIPYFGRNSCKQFIANKPVRFGYKAWVMALKTGYCLQTDIYQGFNAQRNKKIGLGESVVLAFANKLKMRFPGLSFSFYFDNFFTGVSLMLHLNRLGYGGTGTVRENRLKNLPITDNKTMKKSDRGHYESCIDEGSQLVITRWNDNNVVTVLSNIHSAFPVYKTKRFNRKEKKRIDIPQPHCIREYNINMGGVDLMDNSIANYRINIRGNRFYFPVFLWLLDVAMNNAWILSRSYGCTLDNLEFRRQIVVALLSKYGESRSHPGRPSTSRFSERSGPHLIVTEQQRLRCKLCGNKTTKKCVTCNVALHDKCFQLYHTK